MRVLFCGDINGRSGRDVFGEQAPRLKEKFKLDAVIVNGENAAAGFGITRKICDELFQSGADLITLGNHAWDQRDIIPHIQSEPRLIRPINYPDGTPGKGYSIFETDRGKRLLVINAMCRLFMDPLGDPFPIVDEVLKGHPLGGNVNAILLDFHGEATSEKMCMANYIDGRASMVVGTHTHVPTADYRVLPQGTGYMTDAGMCGDYDSIIGMSKEVPIKRFTTKMPTERMSPALGEGTLSGVMFETDDKSGLTTRLAPVIIGPHLANTEPDWD